MLGEESRDVETVSCFAFVAHLQKSPRKGVIIDDDICDQETRTIGTENEFPNSKLWVDIIILDSVSCATFNQTEIAQANLTIGRAEHLQL